MTAFFIAVLILISTKRWNKKMSVQFK